MQIDEQLDVKGLNCPMPMLKTKKALAKMSGGQVLEVLATDKNVFEDFDVFCQQTGHELLLCENTEEGVYRLILRKKAA